LIATLLLGNEVVNVSVSAVMAGMCGVLFAGYGEVQVALITTLLALPLLLFLGEITPKTIAIKANVGWARRVARPLWLYGVLVTPLRIVVRAVARFIIRPFGGGVDLPDRDFGEEEFKALVDAGSAEGEVDAHEKEMIHRVFEFGDKTVAEVMLPRDEVFALSYELSYPRMVSEIAARGFSRIPIYQKSIDNVRGVIYAKDLVIHAANAPMSRTEAAGKGSYRLQDVLHPPLFVPQTTPVKTLFRIFKQRRMHMALVVNEYGKLTGLCTMEDLLEELFGEIEDEREERKKSVRMPRLVSEPTLAVVPDPPKEGTS
jgi:CBS domain containing-hemolysin-like protein